ncbi:AbrB/MazE/SpoVT family DNA-binding domain-containing protein [Tissierella creatinini]|nr:AbrB/MazE/SpoVT family DNA-binding domain-containing protein [Tissierella creatinini]TJX57552.1 AbrB/MazE/SpoVT family DNA-binding domain-containing protein [Soehngenia saccharolytica]
MPTTAMKDDFMNSKIISVSKKRQITIPLDFYKKLDLSKEVECSLEDGKIIIQPLHKDTSEFSVEILKDLVSQGYSGNELVEKFETQSKGIKNAITNMREEADAIAAGEKPAATFDDIFGSED